MSKTTTKQKAEALKAWMIENKFPKPVKSNNTVIYAKERQ